MTVTYMINTSYYERRFGDTTSLNPAMQSYGLPLSSVQLGAQRGGITFANMQLVLTVTKHLNCLMSARSSLSILETLR